LHSSKNNLKLEHCDLEAERVEGNNNEADNKYVEEVVVALIVDKTIKRLSILCIKEQLAIDKLNMLEN
jgi:hypothetical protein